MDLLSMNLLSVSVMALSRVWRVTSMECMPTPLVMVCSTPLENTEVVSPKSVVIGAVNADIARPPAARP